MMDEIKWMYIWYVIYSPDSLSFPAKMMNQSPLCHKKCYGRHINLQMRDKHSHTASQPDSETLQPPPTKL